MRTLMALVTTIILGGIVYLAFSLWRSNNLSVENFVTTLVFLAIGWLILISYFFGISKRISFANFGVSSEITRDAGKEIQRLQDVEISAFIARATTNDRIPYAWYFPLESAEAIVASKKKIERQWAKLKRKYDRIRAIPILEIGASSSDSVFKRFGDIHRAVEKMDELLDNQVYDICVTYTDKARGYEDQFFCLLRWNFFEPKHTSELSEDENSQEEPVWEEAKELWELIHNNSDSTARSLNWFKKASSTKRHIVNFSQIDVNEKSIDAITEMLCDDVSFLTVTKNGEPHFVVNLVNIMSEVLATAVKERKKERVEKTRSSGMRRQNPFVHAARLKSNKNNN